LFYGGVLSKGNGWVKIDKNLKHGLPKDKRPYTTLEAMFSFTCDQDEGLVWSIKGYSKLWNWSRNKVRRFIKNVRTPEGHPVDTRGTPCGHHVHFIDKALQIPKDTKGTLEGHPRDTQRTPTKKTKTKTKTNNIEIPPWIDKNLWREFTKMRIEIKKPITSQITVTRLANKLKKLIGNGYSQEDIIGLAIENCWQSFYEPKEKPKTEWN
jgi:hypothetical protein